jgi:hypothetical protein
MTSFNAMVCTALEGPGALLLQEMQRKPLGSREVRLRVLASGINFPDLLMTRGEYQFRPDPPFTPGLEVAGEIIELGSEASASLGERVCATSGLGGYASEVTVANSALKIWPEGFSAAEAAWSPSSANQLRQSASRRFCYGFILVILSGIAVPNCRIEDRKSRRRQAGVVRARSSSLRRTTSSGSEESRRAAFHKENDGVELDGLDDTRLRIIDVNDVRHKSVSRHDLRRVCRHPCVS